MGTIVIRVYSNGGTGTFGFSGPGASRSLTTTGAPVGVAETSMSVSAGTHAWTQASAAGWRLRGVDCSDRDAGPYEWRSTTSGATATFNVQPGETVTCTYTNDPD